MDVNTIYHIIPHKYPLDIMGTDLQKILATTQNLRLKSTIVIEVTFIITTNY